MASGNHGTCTVEGCERLVQARGYCPAHYQRHRKGLEMSTSVAVRAPAGSKMCQQSNCDRVVKAKGYCDIHYRRVKSGVDMGAPIKQKLPNGVYDGAVCKHLGCDRPVRTQGWCNAHHIRHLRGKSMDEPVREIAKHGLKKGDPCPTLNCDRKVDIGGLCSVHYRRQLEGRNLDAPMRRPRKSRGGLDRLVNDQGYVEVRRPGHFGKGLAGKNIWFYEHRYVMECYLGRPLGEGENVHHKDSDRTNNQLENLELWFVQQPSGQRVVDLIKRSYWLRERYQHEREKLLSKSTDLPGEGDE